MNFTACTAANFAFYGFVEIRSMVMVFLTYFLCTFRSTKISVFGIQFIAERSIICNIDLHISIA